MYFAGMERYCVFHSYEICAPTFLSADFRRHGGWLTLTMISQPNLTMDFRFPQKRTMVSSYLMPFALRTRQKIYVVFLAGSRVRKHSLPFSCKVEYLLFYFSYAFVFYHVCISLGAWSACSQSVHLLRNPLNIYTLGVTL